jgi:hypothetical protein
MRWRLMGDYPEDSDRRGKKRRKLPRIRTDKEKKNPKTFGRFYATVMI